MPWTYVSLFYTEQLMQWFQKGWYDENLKCYWRSVDWNLLHCRLDLRTHMLEAHREAEGKRIESPKPGKGNEDMSGRWETTWRILLKRKLQRAGSGFKKLIFWSQARDYGGQIGNGPWVFIWSAESLDSCVLPGFIFLCSEGQ